MDYNHYTVAVCHLLGDFLLIREEERRIFSDFFPEGKGMWTHVYWKE